MGGIHQIQSLKSPNMPFMSRRAGNHWETTRLMMPYVGLAAAYAVLVLGLNTPQALAPSVIVAWVAVVIVLAVLRQLLVIRENQRLTSQLALLNTRLEERVQERTAALRRANQELNEREYRLTYNALHDSLTNLPNRALLLDRLDHALQRAHRDPAAAYGVLFMDLDGFKVINDSLGHLAGDRLLVEIARRLTASVREIDTVARLGGDEFVILLEDILSADYLSLVAERVLAALASPVVFDGQHVSITSSIGIIASSPEYKVPSDVLRDADLAMYEAKALGKSRAVVFTAEMRSNMLDRLILEKDLALALEENQLFLQYEPILHLENGRLAGFEALLRWQHPRLGLIAPGSFIPIAEANGTIVPITYWVLGEALRQVMKWRSAFPDLPEISVSVNLSPRLFSHPDLVPRIHNMLLGMDVPPNLLILEITESALIQEMEKALQALGALRQLGLGIHLDDFGTGYSSLSYLNHQLPVDALKVAHTFVSQIQPDGKNAEIVRTIVNLAHQLHMTVIAEGIETGEQMEFIHSLGCESGQGYFISRSLNSPAATQFIGENAARQSNQ
jgi:diguanylate cyclase (GGDEF)-like protein